MSRIPRKGMHPHPPHRERATRIYGRWVNVCAWYWWWYWDCWWVVGVGDRGVGGGSGIGIDGGIDGWLLVMVMVLVVLVVGCLLGVILLVLVLWMCGDALQYSALPTPKCLTGETVGRG